MNALAQSAPPIAQPATVPLLRTLVLCDLVDSTALVGRLGDQRAAELFRKHDRAVRDLLQTHGGREIDKTDGFLAMFERPIQAVAFALDYQRQLRRLGEDERNPLVARVGVHVGDVLTWDNTPDDVAKGAKATEVEGLVKPIASRLMQLALPGQTLLSGVAYSLAHRAQGELGERLATVRWRTHGRYQFKGVPDPIPVFEVGEEGLAPLKAPPWSGKAHREVPFWRRPASLTIELVLLAIVAAIPLWYLLKPAPAIAFANRDWVVVGDLKNLTGESKFDESLQTAFRIGLEQSRYVNVLSDLKTRETIKLMRRDPEKTSVDRAVGSEIAIRDGARALILPTIAEIGGRVRVTAEVIDPNTQTTVYSESADGVGEPSVLPSLDKVNQQLRVRLGEALATVSNESRPLEKAATKDLEALRAYSLGRRAYNSGDMKEALELLRQATKLDPDFALARTTIASIHFNVGENTEALKEIDRAMAARDRLSPRDTLFVEARRAQFGSPAAALEKWKALSKLYPDFAIARGWFGYMSWQYANRFDDAIQAYLDLNSPQNPDSGLRDATLGVWYLGQEKYDEARRRLTNWSQLGFAESRAAVDAAQRQFDKLDSILKSNKNVDVVGEDVTTQNARVAFAVDQGRWNEAWKTLAKSKSELAPERARSLRKLRGIEVSLRTLMGEDDAVEQLRTFIQEEKLALEKEKYLDRTETIFHLLFAGYLAATKDDVKLAQQAIAQIGPEAASGEYPVLSRMLAATQAEIARANGKPEEAIRLLQASPLDDSELFVTRVALMHAYAAKGDTAAALKQAEWLAKRRGRAYTEYNADWVARPFNVAQSDLALLSSAEFSAALGDAKQARASLSAFTQAWPTARESKPVSARIQKIETQLAGS
ncbi:putative peptide modification system cyclase [Dokdonella sp.]|uniref:putative peptide modification system cyclase n=1 Tax=Dokdonella sp. TaxID=2291710 RepID=UPI001B11B295|nr:putative peptide modification system cyclase [Dokdonella sp.]MBO9661649.1 putative peptide modification system cyclase [Dokdonella sp.]